MSAVIVHIAYEVNRLNRFGDTAEKTSHHCKRNALEKAREIEKRKNGAVAVERHTVRIYQEICDYDKTTVASPEGDHTTVVYREVCNSATGHGVLCSIYRDDRYTTIATLGKERTLRAGGWIR